MSDIPARLIHASIPNRAIANPSDISLPPLNSSGSGPLRGTGLLSDDLLEQKHVTMMTAHPKTHHQECAIVDGMQEEAEKCVLSRADHI